MNIPVMLAQAVIEYQFTTVSTKVLVLLGYMMASYQCFNANTKNLETFHE